MVERLLKRGARGRDIERLQRALNQMGASPPLELNGEFDATTERAVRRFQEMMKLLVDGTVGGITHAVLFAGSFRYELRPPPPWVHQGFQNLCWAASLESVLRSTWTGRPRLTVADLRSRYSSHLMGDIDLPGFRQVGHDLRFREILVGQHVRAEHLVRVLQNGRPLLLVDNSTGTIMHTRVLYGIAVSHGAIDLLLMDPMAGYTALPIANVQVLTQIGFFAPNEIGL